MLTDFQIQRLDENPRCPLKLQILVRGYWRIESDQNEALRRLRHFEGEQLELPHGEMFYAKNASLRDRRTRIMRDVERARAKVEGFQAKRRDLLQKIADGAKAANLLN